MDGCILFKPFDLWEQVLGVIHYKVMFYSNFITFPLKKGRDFPYPELNRSKLLLDVLPGVVSLAAFRFYNIVNKFWNCFNIVMQHHICFTFISIKSCTDFWTRSCTNKIDSSTSKTSFIRVEIGILLQPMHVWKWFLMLTESSFHNLSFMNRGIVILEFGHGYVNNCN